MLSLRYLARRPFSKANDSHTVDRRCAPCRRVWGDPPTAQQGRQLAADRSDFLDFSSTIPNTSSFIVRMGNFGCFLSESQGESRQAVRSITSGREEMMIMQTCSAIST